MRDPDKFTVAVLAFLLVLFANILLLLAFMLEQARCGFVTAGTVLISSALLTVAVRAISLIGGE